MSVVNRTFYLYTMVYMSGPHVSTQSVILSPSKNTDLSVVQVFFFALWDPKYLQVSIVNSI